MKEKAKAVVEYRVKGLVGHWYDRPADPDIFYGAELDEEVVADDDASAIKKAKQIVQKFLNKNKEHCPKGDDEESDLSCDRPVLRFTLSKITLLWGKEYSPPESARPAVPAKPAVPAVPSSVSEVIYDE